MKHQQSVPAYLLVAALLGACSTQQSYVPSSAPPAALPLTTIANPQSKDTILLVSLEDGSVIMQTIQSGADICFKQNSDSTTTCLTQSTPIIDPDSNAVIGFEMTEERIELVAKGR